MKKHILFLFLLISGLGFGASAQQTQNPTVRAQFLLPSGMQFARGQEQQIQIRVNGLDESQEYLRTRTVDVNSIPGITTFNMILDDNNEDGYFDLRFTASTKAEFETMIREVFCRLDIQSVLINDTAFENCRLLTIP